MGTKKWRAPPVRLHVKREIMARLIDAVIPGVRQREPLMYNCTSANPKIPGSTPRVAPE